MQSKLDERRGEQDRLECEARDELNRKISAAREAEEIIYREMVTRTDGISTITMHGLGEALRSLRDLMLGGISHEQATAEINQIIAAVRLMAEPKPVFQQIKTEGYPHWSSDGWRLFWKRRPSKTAGHESGDQLETVDIGTINPGDGLIDKNLPVCGFTYYLYGEAMTRNGKKRTLYFGTRVKIDQMLRADGYISAEACAKSPKFESYTIQTKVWRVRQAIHRGQLLSV
jgi:hypothetical protein